MGKVPKTMLYNQNYYSEQNNPLKWSLWTFQLVLDLISIKRLILFKSHNLSTNARSNLKRNFTIKNWARPKQASLILPLTCSNVYLSYRLTFASLDLINSLLARSRCLCFCVYLWPYSLVFFFIILLFILLRRLISKLFPFLFFRPAKLRNAENVRNP